VLFVRKRGYDRLHGLKANCVEYGIGLTIKLIKGKGER
jgi:hypothetical protein